MNTTVIDTLRFATRLKKGGFPPEQAEAVSRAINDELTDGVATKAQVDGAVTSLRGEIDGAVTTLRGEIDGAVTTLRGEIGEAVTTLRGEIGEAMSTIRGEIGEAVTTLRGEIGLIERTMLGKFAQIDGKFAEIDGKFQAVDARFDAMDTKFDALSSKVDNIGRYAFLVLALLVALGLYNAVAPRTAPRVLPSTSPAAEAVSERGARSLEGAGCLHLGCISNADGRMRSIGPLAVRLDSRRASDAPSALPANQPIAPPSNQR